MSGCRRITPTALQGASSSMRSNGRPSHQSCGRECHRPDEAGAATQSVEVIAHQLAAARGRDRAPARPRAAGHASRMWPVLPPGAAHASSTRCPRARSSKPERHAAPRRPARTRRRPRSPATFRPRRASSTRSAVATCSSAAARLDARGGQPCEIVVACRAPLVHAQPHRRGRIVRGADPLPVVGPVVRELLEQPTRMAGSRASSSVASAASSAARSR